MALKKKLTRTEEWQRLCGNALDALSDLSFLQSEYQEILDNLPENLETSPYGERLSEVCELDLDGALEIGTEAADIALPLGFGRD